VERRKKQRGEKKGSKKKKLKRGFFWQVRTATKNSGEDRDQEEKLLKGKKLTEFVEPTARNRGGKKKQGGSREVQTSLRPQKLGWKTWFQEISTRPHQGGIPGGRNEGFGWGFQKERLKKKEKRSKWVGGLGKQMVCAGWITNFGKAGRGG